MAQPSALAELLKGIEVRVGRTNILPFLKHFYDERLKPEEKVMKCSHEFASHRPAGQSPCFTAGTRVKNSSPVIRRSVVLNKAADYAKHKLHKTGEMLRVPHTYTLPIKVAFILKALDYLEVENGIEKLMAQLEEKMPLLHLCGHGVWEAKEPSGACVNPQHTRWGTSAQNMYHKYAHAIIGIARTRAEYIFLLELFKREHTNAITDIF